MDIIKNNPDNPWDWNWDMIFQNHMKKGKETWIKNNMRLQAFFVLTPIFVYPHIIDTIVSKI